MSASTSLTGPPEGPQGRLRRYPRLPDGLERWGLVHSFGDLHPGPDFDFEPLARSLVRHLPEGATVVGYDVTWSPASDMVRVQVGYRFAEEQPVLECTKPTHNLYRFGHPHAHAPALQYPRYAVCSHDDACRVTHHQGEH